MDVNDVLTTKFKTGNTYSLLILLLLPSKTQHSIFVSSIVRKCDIIQIYTI